MSLFDFSRGDPRQKARLEAAEAIRAASEKKLKYGGLPTNAEERLRHQRALQDSPAHLWTGDLSVNELLLVKQAGYEPLGQVMGASIFQFGYQGGKDYRLTQRYTGTSYEVEEVSRAFGEARERAVGRMRQEATILGSDGVVAVRLLRHWSDGIVEFQAIGTAIRLTDTPARSEKYKPFVCSLSGQEFWALKRAGFATLGLAAANCSYYCRPGLHAQRTIASGKPRPNNSAPNCELVEFSQAVYNAREIAVIRMHADAHALGAEGVIGITFEHKFFFHAFEGENMYDSYGSEHIFALGTAIRQERRVEPKRPVPTLSLAYRPVQRKAEAVRSVRRWWKL